MNPHSELLEAGADPYNSASYDKYVQKEYANDLILTGCLVLLINIKLLLFCYVDYSIATCLFAGT